MDPIDLIRSLLPSLTEKQTEELARELLPMIRSPCHKTGHKFKVCEHRPARKVLWLITIKGVTKLFCEKCGEVRQIPVN